LTFECPCGRVYISVDVPLGTHASVVCACGRQFDLVPRRAPARMKEALGWREVEVGWWER
jgi:hypothetical protein